MRKLAPPSTIKTSALLRGYTSLSEDHNGQSYPLQIGVTTDSHGLGLRLDIVSKLPTNAGSAISKVGSMRATAKASAAALRAKSKSLIEDEDISDKKLEENSGVTTPNCSSRPGTLPKPKLKAPNDGLLPKLVDMTEKEMDDVLAGDVPLAMRVTEMTESQHALQIPKQGKILFLWSRPGYSSLLTVATHTVLTRVVDLVRSDKLVLDAILNLLPKNAELRIGRKFSGMQRRLKLR